MNVDFPLHFDQTGRTAVADGEQHIRNMIEQVLLTSPGERLNRPGFGSGLKQLVFAPNSDELAATTQFLVQGALQQWMSDWIQVEAVEVENDEEKLNVSIRYIVRRNGERRLAEFVL